MLFRSLGVANYLKAHFHLDVTAVTGTWDINLQSQDPASNNWATAQNIFSSITAVGTYYADVGELGVCTDLAIEYDPTSAGSITFSISCTLKNGILGSGTGLSKIISVGGPGVSTTSGYPLLEGIEKAFIVGENVSVYGIAATSLTLKVFRL